jgi:hypothetical protein
MELEPSVMYVWATFFGCIAVGLGGVWIIGAIAEMLGIAK